jgi:hypothetical protein
LRFTCSIAIQMKTERDRSMCTCALHRFKLQSVHTSFVEMSRSARINAAVELNGERCVVCTVQGDSSEGAHQGSGAETSTARDAPHRALE